ncbi:MAG: hypothetical protein AABZ06_11660 [Bdellovibrionota bacterium]
MNVIETIRQEVLTCGKTRYRIAQDTGVSQAQLHRMIYGGSLKAETVGTLLEYLGYELKEKKQKGR